MTLEQLTADMGIPKAALLSDSELSKFRRTFILKAFKNGSSVESIAEYLERRPTAVLHVLRMLAHDQDRGDYGRTEKQLEKVLR